MRVELRDGQWADLRERITHGVDKEIKNARRVSARNEGQSFDWVTVLVRAFVRDWDVRDPDGRPIPAADPDAIERAPDDIVDDLFDRAAELWVGATVPNQQYAGLIGRLILGHRVSESEVDALPDPDTFRDALLLATDGQWTPKDLDETDAMLLALVRKIKNTKVKRG